MLRWGQGASPENGTVKSKSTSVAGGSCSRHTISGSVAVVASGSSLEFAKTPKSWHLPFLRPRNGNDWKEVSQHEHSLTSLHDTERRLDI
jgi:hypothetical protein